MRFDREVLLGMLMNMYVISCMNERLKKVMPDDQRQEFIHRAYEDLNEAFHIATEADHINV